MSVTHSARAELSVSSRSIQARWGWLEPLSIFLLALLINWMGNGSVSLWDRDEPRYAGCTREMIASGTWVNPTFNGEPFYHKPVLTYWLMRVGFMLAGDGPFGARLMSGLTGAAMCLAVWAWGRRMIGPTGGRWAALALLTAPIVVIESKLATTDAPLVLWIVLAQWCLWELSRGPSWRAAMGFWACLALSILTKGPVGPAVIGVSAVASWWWGGSTKYLARLRWLPGVALCVALTAPWFVAIEVLSHGEFHRILLGEQVLTRASRDFEGHPGFPGYYLGVTALTFFPWTILIPAALIAAWPRRRSQPELGFLLGWIGGPLLMFEVAQTKLLHYYYPSYPALALLVGWVISGLLSGEIEPLGRRARRGLFGLLRGIGGAWVIAPAVGAVMLPAPFRLPCIVMSLIAAVGVCAAHYLFSRGRFDRAVGSLAASWALLLFFVGGWLLPAAETNRITVLAGNRLRQESELRGLEPVLFDFKPPGLIYQVGRPVPVFAAITKMKGRVKDHGEALAALRPWEVQYLRKRTNLDVNVIDVLVGADVEKFQNQTVLLSLIGDHSAQAAPKEAEAGPADGLDTKTSTIPLAEDSGSPQASADAKISRGKSHDKVH